MGSSTAPSNSSGSPPPLPISISTPLVPLLSHPALQSVLAPNHLPSLAALLRPFTHSFSAQGGQLNARALNLQTVSLPNWGLRVVDFDDWEGSMAEGEQGAGEGDVGDALGAALQKLAKERSEDERRAWETTKSLMDASRPEVSWETFAHPLAMIIAIPSTLQEPLVELSKLFTKSRAKERFGKRPWQSEDLLRFIVVVHDLSSHLGSLDQAQRTLESIKKSYGPHCSLLTLNSLPPTLPSLPLLHDAYSSLPPIDPIRTLLNPPPTAQQALRTLTAGTKGGDDEVDEPQGEEGIEAGQTSVLKEVDAQAGAVGLNGATGTDEALIGGRLNDQDVLAIKVFLKEFSGGSLIPWMERTISAHNEVYTSTRKGITGRLFGAGRKLWGGSDSRPSSPGLGGVGYNPIRGFYPNQAPESTNRRLADLAFLLRDYKYAATIYDGIRKDYVSDKASMYVAGSTEMLGLSLLLANPTSTVSAAAAQTPLVESYFDSALATYTSSPLPQLASVRMAVTYTELYRQTGNHRSAGQALVKAAGDAEEVWAAVLLQEAADVEGRVEKLGRGGTGRERRQAGNWVEAAKRFEVCGLKSYSTRCLERALVIYRRSTWTQAQFFVEHALGRQAYTMGQSDVAVEHFIRLLGLAEGQSGGWLDDFELAFQHLAKHHPEKIVSLPSELPKALFDTKRTRVRTIHESSHRRSDPAWATLEDDFLRLGSFEGGAKPTSLLKEESNIVSFEEPFDVVLEITNPLGTPLKLGNLTVGGGGWSSSLEEVEVQTVEELILDPGESREIAIKIRVHANVKTIKIENVSFLFHNLFAVRQTLERRGARLHTTKAQRLTPTYAEDPSLTVNIHPQRPLLVLETDELPSRMAQGETRKVSMRLRNEGGAPATSVSLLAGGIGLIKVLGLTGEAGPSSQPIYSSTSSATPFTIPNTLDHLTPTDLELPSGGIAPGGHVTVEVLLHAHIPASSEVLFLLAYRSEDDSAVCFASTASHPLSVEPVLEVFANHRPSAAQIGHHVVSMEFTTLSSEAVNVTGVQMISPSWEATTPGGRTSISTMTTLGDSQRLYLQLSARPPADAAPPDLLFTATKLRQMLSGKLDTETRPPPVDLATSPSALGGLVDLASSPLQPLLLTQLSALRSNYLSAQYPLIPTSDFDSIFPLIEPRDIVILIFFALPSLNAQGHLVIGGLSPGPSESIFLELEERDAGKGVRSMFEQTDKDKWALAESVLEGPLGREDDPIRLNVKVAEEEVEHDFSAGPCSLEVSYHISNTSPRLSTRVTFSLLEPPPSTLYAHGFPTGSLTHTFLLPPLSSQTVQTTYIASRAGTYDVEGSWSLVVSTGQPIDSKADSEEEASKERRRFERMRRDEGQGRVVSVSQQRLGA